MVHGGHHLGGDDIGGGHAYEDIGSLQGIGQSAGLAGQVGDLGHFLLHPVQAFRSLGKDARFVAHEDVREAVGQQKLCDGHAGAARSVYHYTAVFLLLAHHLQGVDDARQHHDGGAVLVVMEDGDVQSGFQPFFYLKASGGADVLQIDAAEAGGQPGDRLDDLLGVLGVQADGHCVDPAEFLEQDGLALHHRHGGVGADVAQTQDGAAIGDYGYSVGFHGVFVSGFFVLGDDLAGLRHPRRIGDGQVFPGFHGSLGDGLQLAVPFFML